MESHSMLNLLLFFIIGLVYNYILLLVGTKAFKLQFFFKMQTFKFVLQRISEPTFLMAI